MLCEHSRARGRGQRLRGCQRFSPRAAPAPAAACLAAAGGCYWQRTGTAASYALRLKAERSGAGGYYSAWAARCDNLTAVYAARGARRSWGERAFLLSYGQDDRWARAARVQSGAATTSRRKCSTARSFLHEITGIPCDSGENHVRTPNLSCCPDETQNPARCPGRVPVCLTAPSFRLGIVSWGLVRKKTSSRPAFRASGCIWKTWEAVSVRGRKTTRRFVRVQLFSVREAQLSRNVCLSSLLGKLVAMVNCSSIEFPVICVAVKVTAARSVKRACR